MDEAHVGFRGPHLKIENQNRGIPGGDARPPRLHVVGVAQFATEHRALQIEVRANTNTTQRTKKA